MTSPADKARQIHTAVSSGQTVFTKAPTGWMVVGPAANIEPARRVTVTRKDGSTTEVIIKDVTFRNTVAGVSYNVANFVEATVPAHTRAAARPGYTEVRNAAFGTGRRYHAQPGATQYDDGSGRYSVQIWDES